MCVLIHSEKAQSLADAQPSGSEAIGNDTGFGPLWIPDHVYGFQFFLALLGLSLYFPFLTTNEWTLSSNIRCKDSSII